MTNFDYNIAFSRNIGWFTNDEQKIVSNAVIGIPGCGGVGGQHLHCLLRMGFQKFKLADFDVFEIQNFNRQFGAVISNIGISKTEALRNMALDINPNAEIEIYENGITEENIENFIDGCDILADGLDLYASQLRPPLYDTALKKGVYVLSAGPFGMGTSLMAFHPKKMGFNEYFDFDKEELTVEGMIIRFLAGMSPNLLHQKYVAAPDAVDLFGGRLPSLHIGCYAASSALAAAAVKIVLDRGKVLYAPRGVQVDFYRNKWKSFWMPFGNRNPIQKAKIKTMHHMFKVKEFN